VVLTSLGTATPITSTEGDNAGSTSGMVAVVAVVVHVWRLTSIWRISAVMVGECIIVGIARA